MDSRLGTIIGVFVAVWIAALSLALGSVVLMGLGLGVEGLSEAVGAPLPTVHDNPDRIEWGGLALDVLYGVVGAAVLCACFLAGRRVLGPTARSQVGRALGTLVLIALAAGGVWVAIDGHDLRVALFAAGCGYGATRVARGLPIDDDENDDDPGSALPAALDTPPTIINDEPTTRAKS